MEAHPENAGTPYAVLLGLLGRDIYTAGGGQPAPPVPANDLPAYVQQPILDAAWSAVKPSYKQTPLMIGLVDVSGDYAWALAQPFGKDMLHVYLKRQGDAWKTLVTTPTPMPNDLKKFNIPQGLQQYSELFAVTIASLDRVQNPSGQGMDGYLTRVRVSGDFARLWTVPSQSVPLDSASTFYKRTGGTWRFLSAGTAFPEEDLRSLGVPQELWPYGELIRGPA